MTLPTEHDIRLIASEIASIQAMVQQYANQELRVLASMLERAYTEALFQAQMAYEDQQRETQSKKGSA